MPPKAKYTKEQITDAAYGLVQKYGEEFLTARSLAAELGVSTAPIFTAFDTIEDVVWAVKVRAYELYKQYIDEGLLKYTPPFKGAGLKYIQYAKDEPQLFKMLFMSDCDTEITHYFPSGDEKEGSVRGVLERSYGYSEEKAKRIYNHLSVYAHGLAVLYAQGRCVFTDEDVSLMLTEIFEAVTHRDNN